MTSSHPRRWRYPVFIGESQAVPPNTLEDELNPFGSPPKDELAQELTGENLTDEMDACPLESLEWLPAIEVEPKDEDEDEDENE